MESFVFFANFVWVHACGHDAIIGRGGVGVWDFGPDIGALVRRDKGLGSGDRGFCPEKGGFVSYSSVASVYEGAKKALEERDH